MFRDHKSNLERGSAMVTPLVPFGDVEPGEEEPMPAPVVAGLVLPGLHPFDPT